MCLTLKISKGSLNSPRGSARGVAGEERSARGSHQPACLPAAPTGGGAADVYHECFGARPSHLHVPTVGVVIDLGHHHCLHSGQDVHAFALCWAEHEDAVVGVSECKDHLRVGSKVHDSTFWFAGLDSGGPPDAVHMAQPQPGHSTCRGPPRPTSSSFCLLSSAVHRGP